MNGKTRIGLAVVAALVAAIVGWSGQAPAQTTKSDPAPSAAVSGAPDKIEGTVTAIDVKNLMVTVRGDDGQIHSFKGDAATLNDLKVGDKLTLNKRPGQAPTR